MDIIQDVFKKTKPDFKKLKSYGFVLNKGYYSYTKKLIDPMELRFSIDQKGNIISCVYDTDMNEEYDNVNSDSQYGAFVSQVRNAYIEELEKIREACFDKDLFAYAQSKRISEYMAKQYGSKPEFLWKRFPGYAVFRDKSGGKWFGILMNVDGTKVGLDKKEYEILVVRSDPNMISGLKNETGFYEAYHMDKDKWITIILNDTVDDEVIHSLVDYSFDQAERSDVWIVPANPKYYDVVGELEHNDSIIWKQSSDIHVGDIVYLYVAEPYSAILYKCMAEEVNIPYEYKDKNVSMSRVMRIRVLKRFDKNKYPYSYLNTIGIKMLRGPRRLKKETAEKLG